MMTLVNMLDEQLEVLFDGTPYVFEAGQELTVPEEIGRHLRKRSLLRDNPVSGKGVFALAVKGVDDQRATPTTRPVELLDRSGLLDPKARDVQYVTLTNPVVDVPTGHASALDNFADGQLPNIDVRVRRV